MSNTNSTTPFKTEAEVTIDAGVGLASIEDRIHEIDGIPVAIIPNGMTMRPLEEVLKLADARDVKPHRLKGTSTHQELASFIAHVNAFKDEDSAVFADTNNVKLTAVLNYHHHQADGPRGDDGARWADHRSVYACPLSREWLLWQASNEKQMSQEQFCEFLEDNAVDLANPTEDERALFPLPAAVLEMTRSLSIKIVGECTKKINPTTGEVSLVYRDEHGPESTKIPRAFLLGIPIFEAGERWRVEARLRFTLQNNTKPLFSYSLYQHEDVKRRAFGEVRAQVEKGTGLVLFAGTPEV